MPTDNGWDLFISHASADKPFVRPLAEALQGHGLSVWYDDFELPIGAPLRSSIDQALLQSKAAVVVLSTSFLGSYWTQMELDAVLAGESAGLQRILPIWHDVTWQEIAARSPMLANRKALSSRDGVHDIAEKIHRALSGEVGTLPSAVSSNLEGTNLAAVMPAPASDHDVAIVSSSIVNGTELLAHPPREAKALFAAYQRLFHRSLEESEAQRSEGEGSVIYGTFLGPRRAELAVLTGIRLLQEVQLLNLDGSLSALGVPLQVRIAAVCGTSENSAPTNRIDELVFRECDRLRDSTRTLEFLISSALYDFLPEGMQRVFEPVHRPLEGQQLYLYGNSPRPARSENFDIRSVLALLDSSARSIRSQCDRSSAASIDETSVGQIHSEVKRFYELVASFRKRFASLDSNWSASYLRTLRDATLKVVRLEESVWQRLRDWSPRALLKKETMASARLALADITQLRASEEWSLAELTRNLKVGLSQVLGREAEDSAAGLTAPLRRLEAATSEIERLAAFLALRRFDWNLVTEHVKSRRRKALIAAFWEVADLVVAEEAKSEEGSAPSLDALFGLLLNDRHFRGRFQVVEHFLGEALPSARAIESRFRLADLTPTSGDVEIVWRAVMLAHPNSSIRYAAAQAAPLSALWSAIAYRDISLVSLSVIAERIDRESDEFKRIFFDCVRFRLERRIQEGGLADLRVAAHMVAGFYRYRSELFLVTRYFRALEALRALYEVRVHLYPGELQSLLQEVLIIDGAPPQEVVDLPPALQKHLAQEGHYVEVFARSQNASIALEILPFLVGKNLDKLGESLGETEDGDPLEALNPELRAKMTRKGLQRVREAAIVVQSRQAAEGSDRGERDCKPGGHSPRSTLGSRELERIVRDKLGFAFTHAGDGGRGTALSRSGESEDLEAPSLEEWNQQALRLAESLLGVVSPNFRMVALHFVYGRWHFQFVLEWDRSEDRVEIDKALRAFDRGQVSSRPHETEIQVTRAEISRPAPPTRVVFLRREAIP